MRSSKNICKSYNKKSNKKSRRNNIKSQVHYQEQNLSKRKKYWSNYNFHSRFTFTQVMSLTQNRMNKFHFTFLIQVFQDFLKIMRKTYGFREKWKRWRRKYFHLLSRKNSFLNQIIDQIIF